MDVQLGPSSVSVVDSPTAADARYYNHHYNSDFDLHRHPPFRQNDYYAASSAPSLTSKMCKRKAESQDNERLTKRLSLLNLEKNGQKLYVPVESPTPQPAPETGYTAARASSSRLTSAATSNDGMQLDDTKHKVYIYDLDAELSSADENSESESSPGSPTSGRGRLVFLPDIRKHLSRSRIPPAVFANKDGELAGHNLNDMQIVLYRDSEPSSLTVAPEHDSVRRAILEARARLREKQREKQQEREQGAQQKSSMPVHVAASPSAVPQNFGYPNGSDTAMGGLTSPNYAPNLAQSGTSLWPEAVVVDDDPDAMDVD